MALSDELKSTISDLITNAQSGTDIGTELFDRYMAEPYAEGPLVAVKGRSSFVSSDVSDVVESVFTEVMDVFTSTNSMVDFDPVGEEDEAASKQETAVVNHIFWEKNPGFEILSTWVKEALIQKNAYVRRGWVEKERIEIEEYEDLTPDELIVISQELDAQDYEYKVLEKSGGINEETGELDPIGFKVRCAKKDKRYVIEAIPNEEFFCTPRWGKITLEGVPVCGHARHMKRGELKAMGFSDESLDRASGDEGDTEEKTNRNVTETTTEGEEATGDESMAEIMVYETYVYADADGDGIAELLKVWAAGSNNTVLDWEDGSEAVEEVSGIPFSAITPYLVPHRHLGRAPAEMVTDVAAGKTVLMRHTLDNLYATGFPRPHYDENQAGSDTFSDLQNVSPGTPVRTGGAMIEWVSPPSVVGSTLPLIEMFDSLKENRTGATRYNQGLDAESLNKTASGVNQIMNAGQKKNKMIARTMAETGIRDLFLGIHADLRRGPMKEIAVKLLGEWVSVNPRTWKHRTDMTVNIGQDDRDELRQGYMLFGNLQRELAQAGSRMVDDAKIYETAERMGKTFGIKSAAPFLNDPRLMPPEAPAQQAPDPALIIAKAQIDNMNAETARRDKEATAKIELERVKAERDFFIKSKMAGLKDDEIAAKITEDAERLELDRHKAVMKDDFDRDKLEVDALTGVLREKTAVVNSEPPIPYSEVTDG